MNRARAAAGLLVGAVVLTACAGTDTAADGGTEESVAEGTAMEEEVTAVEDSTMEDAAVEDSGDASGAVDAVLATTATAPDGSTFTIDDYAGRTVFVETFATWCSTCRRQLGATQEAAVEAGDDAVFLILSVETTIDPAQLATYAEEEGFGALQFGVLDERGLAVFAEAFGRSVLNPPSTPKFRVTADGEVSGLTTGLESAEEILATLSAG